MVRTVVLFLVILLSGSAIGAKWAAQIRSRNGQEDSAAIARNVANELKLLFHGPVGSLADTFVFSDLLGDGGVDGSHNEQQRETRNAEDAAEEEVFHSALQSHQDVLWHSEQKPLKRVKRGYFSDPSFTDQWFLVSSVTLRGIILARLLELLGRLMREKMEAFFQFQSLSYQYLYCSFPADGVLSGLGATPVL